MSTPRFKYRFMRPDEAGRLAELIGNLQNHQRMKGVTKLPDISHVENIYFHRNNQGVLVANNLGLFTVFVLDKSIPDEGSKSNIIGYLVYSLTFSLSHGRRFYVNSFFIEQPYRRHGLGKKLIQFMQHHAKLLGIRQFDVPFMKDNLIGQKFYKSFGAYLVDEEYNLVCVPSGVEPSAS